MTPLPAMTLAPGSITFPDTILGNSSGAQTITVTNSGQATLTISNVSLSGSNPPDFAQTNICANASLSPGGSCTIQVKFQPTAQGQRTATISIVDNAPGSPHTVSLSGVGDLPFALAPNGSNPTSLSINAGQTAQYLLQLTAASGFTGTVTLGCSGAPAAATCQITPPSVQVNNASSIPFTVSVATTARSFTLPIASVPRSWPLSGFRLAPFALAAVLILCLTSTRKTAQALAPGLAWARVMAGIAFLTLAGASGCGGGSSAQPVQPPPPIPGTPAGTSTLTVSGTSGNFSQTIQLTLTVK